MPRMKDCCGRCFSNNQLYPIYPPQDPCSHKKPGDVPRMSPDYHSTPCDRCSFLGDGPPLDVFVCSRRASTKIESSGVTKDASPWGSGRFYFWEPTLQSCDHKAKAVERQRICSWYSIEKNANVKSSSSSSSSSSLSSSSSSAAPSSYLCVVEVVPLPVLLRQCTFG